MSERDKLIEELTKKGISTNYAQPGLIADFILADRARIVAPLIQWNKVGWGIESACEAINETLKLAGVSHE